MRERMQVAIVVGVATTVRVSEATRARVAAKAAERGRSIGAVVDEALDALDRADFWEQTRAALARHPQAGTADPGWERAARDGLDRE